MKRGGVVLSTEKLDLNKKIAYIFPGQSSQTVGMGRDLYNISRAARDVFDETDDALGFRLSKIIFEGPEGYLCDTVNSQPAIMTVSIACLRAWQEVLGASAGRPAAVAGHSLGEYTSLVVSNVLTLGDGVRLVRERGRLMQDASKDRPGGMAAIIGLDELALGHICAETGVNIANINTDDQVVVSGDKKAVAQASGLASVRGARKVIPLPVSGGFHSSCMLSAKNGLAEVIANFQFQDPQVPIIANCNSAPLTTSDQVKQELMRGLCECVQWKGSVRFMVQSGITHFEEFGPGNVLSSFIRRIEPSAGRETLNPQKIKEMIEAGS